MKIFELMDTFENLENDKVGIRILPNERCKYMKGDEMRFSDTRYRYCEILYLVAKNDAVVFVITRQEAIKNGVVKE